MTRMSLVGLALLFVGISGCASQRQEIRHQTPNFIDERENFRANAPKPNPRKSFDIREHATQRMLIEVLVHSAVQAGLECLIQDNDPDASDRNIPTDTIIRGSSALATEAIIRRIYR